MYKRILLKLSGEQLSGNNGSGIDPEFASWLAQEIKKVVAENIQVVLVIGGGNIARGATISGHGIRRVTADHMGMLATMINALALTDIFEYNDIPTRCLSNIYAEQVAEPFVHRLAEKHLQNGRVVIVAGGTGRPFNTTDTAAVSMALETDCEVVLKATKVKGVYSDDPMRNPEAVMYDSLTHQQAIENPHIKVMDKSAIGLATEHNMPVIVFDVAQPDNILRAARGENIGTKIS